MKTQGDTKDKASGSAASSNSSYEAKNRQRSGSPSKTVLEQRVQLWALAVFLIAMLLGYGLFLDRSIRPDPFDNSVGWRSSEWWLHSIPHPVLSKMPVVPIGARGAFTQRPTDTTWINSQYYPARIAGAAGSPLEAAGGSETTETETSPKRDAVSSDARSKREQPDRPARSQALPRNLQPDKKRILFAKCEFPGDSCLLAGEQEDAPILKTSDGGETFELEPSASNTGIAVYLDLNEEGEILWVTAASEVLTKDRKDGKSDDQDVISINFPGKGSGLWVSNNPEYVGATRWWLRLTNGTEATTELRLYGLEEPLRLDATGALMAPYEGKRTIRDSGSINPKAEQDSDGLLTLRVVEDTPGLQFNSVTRLDSNSRRAWLFFALGDKGTIVAGQITPNTPESEEDEFPPSNYRLDLRQLPRLTKANLRNLYFQSGTEIGWVSSGWNDGNEEGERPVILQTRDSGQSWERLSYRHLPAPWTLGLALPALFYALFAFAFAYRDYTSAPNITYGIEDIGSSDQPIGWNDPDVLGLSPIARSLSRFVRNQQTEPPLTIAVTGAWGTGKSSLMNLVAEDLRKVGTRTVWFNAWHHQKEDHMLAALLANIRNQAVPPLWRGSGLLFRLRLILRRFSNNLIGIFTVIAIIILFGAFLSWLIPANIIISKLSNLFSSDFHQMNQKDMRAAVVSVLGAGTLATLIAVLSRLNLNPTQLMATLSDRARIRDFSSQLSFRHRFAAEFSDICDLLRHEGNAGIVIMIDDLDRCSAKNLMEVLEAVNFLATAGRCVIFLGIDEEKVIEELAKQLGADRPNANEYANSYLEKLINIRVAVPSADAENSLAIAVPDTANLRPPSKWPHIIRSTLRAAPDVCAVPLLCMAALAFVFLFNDEAQPERLPSEKDQQPKLAERFGGVQSPAASQLAKPSPVQDVNKFWDLARDLTLSLTKVEEAKAKQPSGPEQSSGIVPRGLIDDANRLRNELKQYLASKFSSEGSLRRLRSGEGQFVETITIKGDNFRAKAVSETLTFARRLIESRRSDIWRLENSDRGRKSQVRIRDQELQNNELDSHMGWAFLIFACAFAFLLLFLGMRRVSILAEDIVSDSADFEHALRLWHPVVFLSHQTPRSIKRYHNRLRLSAMRLRPLKPPSDWIDELFENRTEPTGSATPNTDVLVSDELLVALSAIESFNAGLLDLPPSEIGRAFQQLLEKKLIDDGMDDADNRIGGRRALERFLDVFDKSWPPREEQIEAFRSLNGTNWTGRP